jgi:hypothetical protein
MTDLIHCVYCSAASRTFTSTAVAEILSKAREDNERLGVTGMLLLAEGTFFQVLEGGAEIVDRLFAKIESDSRHTQVTKIIHEPIAKRSFDAWTMGFSQLSRADLSGIAGVGGTNDFFGKGRCFADLDAGRAKKMLEAFREGRWRKSLSGARAAVTP